MLGGQSAIRHAGPQNGVHFRHIGAPQHKGVGMLYVVIATHRLVRTERADKTKNSRCHAMACIGVQVI